MRRLGPALLLCALGCRAAAGEESVPSAVRARPEVSVSSAPSTTTARFSPDPDLQVNLRVYAGPCPGPEMVRVGARSCIDRWEAHLVALDPAGGLRAHAAHLRPPADSYFEARSAPHKKPQAYISRVEASAACRNAGKRLCSWGEWRRACQGPRWRRYPYPGAGRRRACNTGKLHLLHELHADDRPWGYEAHFNDPALSLEPGYLAETGAHAMCVTPEGIADMVGNLHEWVSTTVTDGFVERMEEEPVERLEQPWVEGNGMFLGGFYSTTDQHGPGCHYTTIAHEPTYHDYSTGFRCCADAR
ncbi:MAG: SUMF1/EgtB/PvdO family nonheme iron enzyme [Myxococcota bacterium]